MHSEVERLQGAEHRREALRLAENAISHIKAAAGKGGHDYGRGLLGLGIVYLDMGHFKTAIKNFEEALPLMKEGKRVCGICVFE